MNRKNNGSVSAIFNGRIRLWLFVSLLGLHVVAVKPCFAADTDNNQAGGVSFGDSKTREFSPSRGESIAFPFQVSAKIRAISLGIYSPDGDLLRTIKQESAKEPGQYSISWDGKDDTGLIVPDEAYVPMLTADLDNSEQQTVDPRTNSGGELVDKVPVNITADKAITYQLPAPCRVLVRVGVKGGPMLRNLSSWQVKNAGKNIQRWDGKDEGGILDIRNEQNLGILVIAFKLPEHSVIAYGNQSTDYRTYRTAKKWQDTIIEPDKMKLNRNGVAISPHYFYPRALDAIPKVSLALPNDLPKSQVGLPKVKLNSPVQVKADIAEQDRWMMKQSLYEVAFFIDHEFIAEEEQGYVPLTWQWSPQQLKPGKHLLTVNISGFSGKVGVASLFFEVGK